MAREIAIRIADGDGPEAFLPARRPTHGEFDIALVLDLARAAMDDTHALAALSRLVRGCLDQIAIGSMRITDESAIDVADAICEALDVDEALEGQALAAAGYRLGQCARNCLAADGSIVGPRAPGTELARCAYACGSDWCLAESGPSIEAKRLVREWRRCGGLSRAIWPRAGGLEDQDAVTVWAFGILDEAADLATDAELRRAGARLAPRAAKEGAPWRS